MQGDTKMLEILKLTHQFLQKFCAGNQENQTLLHKHLNLFLTTGVRKKGQIKEGGNVQNNNNNVLEKLNSVSSPISA